MRRFTPHIELVMAAHEFVRQPSDPARERLRVAAISSKEGLAAEYRQLCVAAERAAAAPRHNWKIAQEGLRELLAGIGKAPAPASQPIVCPHCSEISRNAVTCDVCGEELPRQTEAA